MCSSFVMNNILRSEGKAAYSMVGIAGAAIATLVSQCISFAIMLSFFLTGRSTIRLHVQYISKNPNTYKEIIRTGFPSFCRQGIFFLPMIVLLPMWLGLTSIEIAQSLADLLTFLLSIPFAVSFIRELSRLL